MNILVLLRMVPDVVEELELAADGRSLEQESLRMILSESDGHAVEEALLLKERHGGTVTALALDAPEVDDALFTALAKGVDRAVKITGLEPGLTTRGGAQILAQVMATAGLLPADLVLTGTQAIDDLDGSIAPLIAHSLERPFVAIIVQVALAPSGGAATVVKECPGGVRAEFEVQLPAVLGIQAAEKPPRYVPVAKVRAAAKSRKIECLPAPATLEPPLVEVLQMMKPVVTGHAEMLAGPDEEIASKICEILAERGLI
jgi:electron transfer flavoprotein beta subunit